MNTTMRHTRFTRCFQRLVKVSLILPVFLGGTAAQAEWVQFGRTDAFRIYVDQRLIARNGNLAQMWQLMDFAVAQWADERTAVGSIKNLIEYDCTQPRLRLLAGEAYSEQMGAGVMISRERIADPQWDHLEPGSTPEKLRGLACGLKP